MSSSESATAGSLLGGGDDATVLAATEDTKCVCEDGAGLVDMVGGE